jgi:hypothetical protein
VDGNRFDNLVRELATPRTRRRIVGGAIGALSGLVGFREAGLAAKLRGPGQICRSDENCIAGSRCRKDARGRLYCTCDSGTKPCGETCIPNAACCRDAECTSLNTPCATGVCAKGICQTKPKRNGVSCDGGKCCDGSCATCCHGVGQCATCATASECPGQDTDCTKRTCVSGLCGTSHVASGTATTNQAPGDCKRIVCNGSGGTTQVNDATNLPADDSNQCTSAACLNGTPTHLPIASGTVCNQNGGKVCNDVGQCVTCLTPSDCPGENTDCQTVICTNGACGFSRTPAGTPVSSQTPGDCKRVECDGLGGTIEVNDNTDPPVSSNPCFTYVCDQGTPKQSFVTIGTDCGANLICDGAGACVGCVSPSNCPGQDDECRTRTCTSGTCGETFAPSGTAVSQQTIGDCQKNVCDGAGNTTTMDDDTDLPNDDGNPCTTSVCVSGVPTHEPVAEGTSCNANGGSVCNDLGVCVECLTADTCPGEDTACQTRTCQNGICGFSYTAEGTTVSSQTLGDCQRDVCDGNGSVTTVNDDGDLPDDDGNQCTSSGCVDGSPDHSPVTDGAECDQGGGSVCLNGTCVKVDGVACVTGLECRSGFCVDSVCCDSICSDLCQGCTATLKGAGPDGVCGPIAQGTDPHNECPGSRSCDGNGTCDGCDTPADCPGENSECGTITCLDGVCGTSNVQAGTATSVQTQGDCQRSVCDGSGGVTTVADNDDLPDDGNQCTSNLCVEGTPTHSPLELGTECNQSGGIICDGNGACIKQKLRGSECSQPVECTSGYCADGVCCDGPCDATCRACTSALKGSGSDGVCGYIAFGTDPRNECPGDSVCQEFGVCAGCSDPTQCPGDTNECQQPTCTNQTCGMSYTPNGTPVSEQIAGDCKQHVCDGAGKIITIDDDDDTPASGENQCIVYVCSNGESAQMSAPVGTACNQNGGSVCDGAGTCIGCLVPTDCPGSASECATATCVEGQCGLTYAEVGNLCNRETKVCDGAGNCLSQFLNGASCSVDIQCSSYACVDGMCCNDHCLSECRACNASGQCVITAGESCGESGTGICNDIAECLES